MEEGILSDQNAKYFYDILELERDNFSEKRKQQTRGMLLSNIQRKLQEDEDVAFRDSMTGMISMKDLKKHAVERELNASLDQTNRISEMTEQSMIQSESMSATPAASSSFQVQSNRVRKAENDEDNDEDRSCFMSNNSTASNEFRPIVRSLDGRRLHSSFLFNAVTADVQQNSTFNPLRRGSDLSLGNNSRAPSTSNNTITNEGDQHDKRS